MSGKRVWVEISRQNLLDNIATLKNITADAKSLLMAVVKSNAYGHSLKLVTSLIKNDVDWLGVNCLDEALAARQESDQPILILGFTPLDDLSTVFKNGFRQSVFSWGYLQQVIKVAGSSNTTPIIHLKIETGTNRLGISIEDLTEAINKIKSSNLKMEGIYSHLADAENPEDIFTLAQIQRLKEALKVAKNLGVNPDIVHIGASAASILQPTGRLGLMRFGISLYGLWPDEAIKKRADFQLKPVLSWKTVVAQIKQVKAGETIGYGRTFKAEKNLTIAVLPVGYYEGYPRALSNKGHVLVGGRQAPIVGRICMNMTMVDMTDLNIKVGDEVVLIGKQGRAEITAEDVANWADTINYEIVARINPELPRIVK